MEKNTIKKSDVGLVVFDKFKEIETEISNNDNYERKTLEIKGYVNDIFTNYLKIGAALLRVNDLKLYEYNNYENIYDYANKEFNIKATTVKNTIAIVKRFCELNGRLKSEYKDFSYSNLVELLSVDEKEIDKFKPTMTVKAVRSKKVEIDINKRLNDFISDDQYLTKIINHVESFDFTKEFGRKYSISHKVDKKDFIVKDKNSNDYSFKVRFYLKNDSKDFATIKFRIDFKFDGSYRKICLAHDYSSWNNEYNISEWDDIVINIKRFIRDFGSEDKVIYVLNKVKEKKAEASVHKSCKNVIALYGDFDETLRNVIKTKFSKYFYSSSYGAISIYLNKIDDDEKNPAIFEINDYRKVNEGFEIVKLDSKGEEIASSVIFDEKFMKKIEKHVTDQITKFIDENLEAK